MEKDASKIFALFRVFVAAGTCLQSHCLGMKGGLHFSEPLPSNDRWDTHTDTQTDGRDS
jgi:sulfite exporter TauE/SafE